MEEKHRTILRRQWSNIRENLEPNNILSKLAKVLGETDEEEIREQSTRQERCDKLLHILPTRGENAFNVFVKALAQEAPHLAKKLTEAGNKDEPNKPSYNTCQVTTTVRRCLVCLWLLEDEYYWPSPKRERWRVAGKFYPFFSFRQPSCFALTPFHKSPKYFLPFLSSEFTFFFLLFSPQAG